jgi:tetratricopeptide (TPR) repeat protein
MVIWGAVEEEQNEALIDIYLSTLTDDDNSGLRLSLSSRVVAGPRSGNESGKDPAIEASISHKRFNFAPVSLSRQALFERTLVTAAWVKIHASPDLYGNVLLKLPADRAIQAVDMIGAWFKVELPTGGYGFIHAGSFGNLRLPPKTVSGKRGGVNLRAGPGTDHKKVHTIDLNGSFRVLDMRYRERQGLWYRIDLGPQETWVAGWLVEPNFSFPAVHFIAGLYRYYGERHKQGIQAFEQFIAGSGATADNVNLAAAHQLLGASRLLSSAGDGYRDFSRAIELTPYNPNAYLLRSLASLGTARPGEALADMEQALQLDVDFQPARRMVAAAEAIASQRYFNPIAELTRLPSQQRVVKNLLKRFRIDPLIELR